MLDEGHPGPDDLVTAPALCVDDVVHAAPGDGCNHLRGPGDQRRGETGGVETRQEVGRRSLDDGLTSGRDQSGPRGREETGRELRKVHPTTARPARRAAGPTHTQGALSGERIARGCPWQSDRGRGIGGLAE